MTVDAGIGPNFMRAGGFFEHSLDRGITIPDNAYADFTPNLPNAICEMDDQFIYPHSQSCLLTQSMQSNINTLLPFDNFWSSTEYSLLTQEGAFVEHFNPGASSGTSTPFFKTSFTIEAWCVRRLPL